MVETTSRAAPGILLALLLACQSADSRLDLPVGDPERMTAELEVAEERYEQAAEDEDAIVWYGRRLAYLGRFEEAQDVYARGLEIHPGSVRLLRHRGHRWITMRQFERAREDLERAAELCAGHADVIEPDGMPNELGIPRSTLQGNVHYHLALARFLLRDFAGAAASWAACRNLATNDDMYCAAAHWEWSTLSRLGREAEAAAVLEPVHEDMEILENHAYHQLLLLYAGQREVDSLLTTPTDGEPQSAALQFGLAHFLSLRGELERAGAIYTELATRGSNAFGCIAAEAEIAGR